jgi:hypothetical protein
MLTLILYGNKQGFTAFVESEHQKISYKNYHKFLVKFLEILGIGFKSKINSPSSTTIDTTLQFVEHPCK